MDGAVHGNEVAAEAFLQKIGGGISMDDLKTNPREEIFSTVMAELAGHGPGAGKENAPGE